MPITADQREARRNYIGSSDIAALLKLDPWRGPYDVYLEKTCGTEDVQNEAMAIGDMVEEPLVRWSASEQGCLDRLQMNPETIIHANGVMAANLDGFAPETIIFEGKYSSQGDEWGEEGTDQVPDRVIVQVQHAMACVPTAEVAYVPAFITRGNRITRAQYVIERNEELIPVLERAAVQFMENHVRLEHPPADVPPPSWDTIKCVRRQEDLEIQIPDELVERWLKIQGERKDIEKGVKKAEEEAKAAVVAAMGKGTVGLCNLGKVVMTKVNRNGYTVEPSSHWRTKFVEGE